MKEGREGGREGKMDGWMRRREGKKVGWMDGKKGGKRREGKEVYMSYSIKQLQVIDRLCCIMVNELTGSRFL